MATFTTTITYPDGKQQELLAALRFHYGQVLDNGVYRDRTYQELKAIWDHEAKDHFIAIYKKYKRSLNAVEELGASV